MEFSLFAVVIASVLFVSSSLPSASAGTTELDLYPFITDDPEDVLGRKFDYIVVGAGAAGIPLAVTLSENFTVLLLERGPVYPPLDSYLEELAFDSPIVDKTLPFPGGQRFPTVDGVLGGRGIGLGGGTIVNAGLYARGQFDKLQEMGFDVQLALHSYEWVESIMAIRRHAPLLQRAFGKALLSHGVTPWNGLTFDHVNGTRISGATFYDNGTRIKSTAFLSYANPDNIVVLVNHTVNRILFNASGRQPKAYGVEFTNANLSEYYNVSLNEGGEVVLCAGVIGSTQTLLLSGVGPSDKLKNLSIPIVAELPGVAKNVADNPRFDILLLTQTPLEVSSVQVVGIPEEPDVYYEAASLEDQVDVDENTTATVYVIWLMIKLSYPRTKGEIWLRSRNPLDNITILLNYLKDPHDVHTCIRGLNNLQLLNQSGYIQALTYPNASAIPSKFLQVFKKFSQSCPLEPANYEALAQCCKTLNQTIWHYHGGCNRGVVTDDHFRVIGLKGVRVADASIFNETLGTNPQATYLMTGRYGGVTILQDRLAAESLNVNAHKSLGHNAQ